METNATEYMQGPKISFFVQNTRSFAQNVLFCISSNKCWASNKHSNTDSKRE